MYNNVIIVTVLLTASMARSTRREVSCSSTTAAERPGGGTAAHTSLLNSFMCTQTEGGMSVRTVEHTPPPRLKITLNMPDFNLYLYNISWEFYDLGWNDVQVAPKSKNKKMRCGWVEVHGLIVSKNIHKNCICPLSGRIIGPKSKTKLTLGLHFGQLYFNSWKSLGLVLVSSRLPLLLWLWSKSNKTTKT